MAEIKIVQYQPKYAASLADMWNKSGENWGGETTIRTEESIRESVEKNGDIYTFLALDGEVVVGYCGFSNYKQDEGASYIPLLNVRPDYLGKKIGKMLVLKCVEKAIESEWPRLDLYTWAGNNKAVPLYKKCGFFWEKEDQYTHLMNFLPYVMDTEAVQDYFNTIDWYKDSKREIAVVSDGNTEDEFDFYEYKWQKDSLELSMEFERRGRGLTCIETEDYLIKTRLKKQNQVSGASYKIEYELVNKSGQPMQVCIKGVDNKNIKYSFEYSAEIKESNKIYGEYFVEAVKEKQVKIKTHPCVTSLITINGKRAMFKIGVNPKRPILLEVANDNEYKHLGKESFCYLNIKNNYEKNIKVEFELTSNDLVQFSQPKVCLELSAKQKHSFKVPYVVKKYGFYDVNQMINITVDDMQIDYETSLKTALRGYYGAFHGETENGYYLYNGPYAAYVTKTSNYTRFEKLGMTEDDAIDTSIPQIGKPYYSEFKSKKPDAVLFITKDNSEALRLSFNSEKFPNITLHYYVELIQNGIIKMYSELENSSNSKFTNLFVSQDCYYFLANAYIPYNNSVVKSENIDGIEVENWDVNHITENWFFKNYKITAALAWHESIKLTTRGVASIFESKIDSIEANSSTTTKAITVAIDTFKNWHELRNYMGYCKEIKNIENSLSCSINNNNPFLNDSIELAIKEHKKQEIKGTVEVNSLHKSVDSFCKELNFSDNKALVSKTTSTKLELDIVNVKLKLNTKSITRNQAVFFKDKAQVVNKEYIEQNKKVYEVSNGLISLKASPDFSAGIYSMKYKGTEWLTSSFPDPTVKAWWNYYTGGMFIMPENFSFASINNETKQVEFVEVKDNFDNVWAGLKTSLIIKEHEEFKGLRIDEYYLLLSGVPVLCNFAIVINNTGKYLQDLALELHSFIEEENSYADNWLIRCEDTGDVLYKYGSRELELIAKDIFVHGSNKQSYTLTRLLNHGKHEANNTMNLFFDYDVTEVNVEHNNQKIVAPQYTVFSEDRLTVEMLSSLKKLKFKL